MQTINTIRPMQDRESFLEAVKKAGLSFKWRLLSESENGIKFKVSASIFSWGEIVEVVFFNKENAKIVSRSSFPLTVFDWGKNDKNVEKLVDKVLGTKS